MTIGTDATEELVPLVSDVGADHRSVRAPRPRVRKNAALGLSWRWRDEQHGARRNDGQSAPHPGRHDTALAGLDRNRDLPLPSSSRSLPIPWRESQIHKAEVIARREVVVRSPRFRVRPGAEVITIPTGSHRPLEPDEWDHRPRLPALGPVTQLCRRRDASESSCEGPSRGRQIGCVTRGRPRVGGQAWWTRRRWWMGDRPADSTPIPRRLLRVRCRAIEGSERLVGSRGAVRELHRLSTSWIPLSRPSG